LLEGETYLSTKQDLIFFTSNWKRTSYDFEPTRQTNENLDEEHLEGIEGKAIFLNGGFEYIRELKDEKLTNEKPKGLTKTECT
jgi:hypothetical protein